MKIKLFESFINEAGVRRQVWALSSEIRNKIDSEIRNVLIELIDNGFEIEIDHFSKRIAEQNSILVSIHKINEKESFNTNEVKDNLLVLLDYMDENYTIIEYDYDVENGDWPNNRSVSSEYPDNLEVTEIDIDIII